MKYLPIALLAALCACSSDPHPYQAPSSKSSPSSKIKGMASAALPTVEAGASCRSGDRGACACATGPGIRSCEGGVYGECACGGLGGAAGGGGVAMLDPSGGAAGANGGEAGQGGPTGGEAGMGGGAAGASGSAGMNAPDSGTSVDAGDQRFVVNGDGTVTDNSTGLAWQQKSAEFTSRDSAGVLRTSFTVTFDEATAYCNNLDLGGTGWRLPTTPEIMAILDQSFEPALDPAVFVPPHLVGYSGCIDSSGIPRCYFTTTTACGSAQTGNGYDTISMSYTQNAGGQLSAQIDCVRDYTSKAMVRCVR